MFYFTSLQNEHKLLRLTEKKQISQLTEDIEILLDTLFGGGIIGEKRYSVT